MYKIGIIGSDNSHAEAFSQAINIPDSVTGEYMFPDCRVIGIYGEDRERTLQVATDGKIEYIAVNPIDLMGKVDAVMVVFRHGDLHMPHALPFIEAGIPVWIDKPFTIKNEDAIKLIKAAEKNGTLLTGGSTCKYSYDIAMAKNAVAGNSRIGKVKSAIMSFPAEIENEYGGLYFYGAHLVEMTLEAFGYNANSVVATENCGSVIAIVKYDSFQVVMNFIPDLRQYHVLLYGENGILDREIDISLAYMLGLHKFVEMLRSGKLPMPLELLYKSVEMLNAVVDSYRTGNEIFIKK